jgi:drug/metabolite transporter (DMT)-like permease
MNSRLFYILSVFPPLFFAGNFFVARLMTNDIPPFQMSFWRWACAFAMLLPFSSTHLQAASKAIRDEWRFLFLLSAIGVTGFNCLVYYALHLTTVVNAALVNSLMPVVTFVLAVAVLHERFSPQQLTGVAISLAGAAVLITRGMLANIAEVTFNRGDVLVLIGVSLWAGYSILIRMRPSKLEPLVFLTLTAGIGSALHIPLIAWEYVTIGGFAINFSVVASVLYLAVFPSILAYIFWNRSVATLGPAKTSMFMHLMPVFSAVLAVTFLGETVHPYQIFGFALVFCGLYLVTNVRRTR